MSAEKIDLVRDTTMQETNRLLSLIAGKGVTPSSVADVQRIVRAGLASSYFSIGDQLVCEKETAVTATVGNTDGTSGITAAAVNADTFISQFDTNRNGDYEFTYNGVEWHYSGDPVQLATYGVTVTGTAKSGDIIIVHETASTLVWDIIGIDCDTPSDPQFTHSLILQLHDCYSSMQFDSQEAMYCCETELSAGTYNFTLLSGYDETYGGGKTYYFTTTKAIPAGGQIMFNWSYNTQASTCKIVTYADNATSTALETLSVTEGTSGTSLGTADGTGNINHTHRLRYGSNNWLESDIRMRINSTAAAGGIAWTATTKFARKPSWVATEAGFLHGMDSDFLSALGKVKKVTARNTVTDGGGSDTSDELIFLLSRSEVYTGKENNIDEGTAYPYYANYSDLSAAGTGNDTNRIKYRNGATQYWWLRSPYVGHAGAVRGVSPSGALYNYGSAYNSSGLAPACCII